MTGKTGKLRVLIIKDDPKEGLDLKDSRFEIIAETASVNKALDLAEQEVPDIVMIESSVAPAKALDIVAKLKKIQSQINVIMFSYQTEDKFIAEALRIGTSAYIVQTNITAELNEALSRLEHGQVYLSPIAARGVVREKFPTRGRRRTDGESLTERQKEILKHLAQGYTNKQIAQNFKLSVKTVDAHRANIMNKLNIHDLPGLVKYAIRTGLTSLED
jgi:DNA-binding NarL/FixJ family response regulator